MPWTVVISCPSACTAKIVQDLTDSPSINTVHAPQLVVLQPVCTPPIPRFSLRWWRSRSRGSTSATCALPSTVIWILCTYPPFPTTLANARSLPAPGQSPSGPNPTAINWIPSPLPAPAIFPRFPLFPFLETGRQSLAQPEEPAQLSLLCMVGCPRHPQGGETQTQEHI